MKPSSWGRARRGYWLRDWISCGLLVATAAAAQQHPMAGYCSGAGVYTGTVTGTAQLRRLAGNQVRPELVQAAALWALIDESQRAEAAVLIRQRLRAQGKWHDDVEGNLWPIVAADARDAVRKAEVARSAGRVGGGAVLGGVTGGLAGGLIGGLTGQGIGSGAGTGAKWGAGLGAGVALPSASVVKLTVGVVFGSLFDQTLDNLLRNPCTVSAEDALRIVTRPR